MRKAKYHGAIGTGPDVLSVRPRFNGLLEDRRPPALRPAG